MSVYVDSLGLETTIIISALMISIAVGIPLSKIVADLRELVRLKRGEK